MLIGLLGMFVILFAVARMSVLERNSQRPSFADPHRNTFVGSGV